MIILIAPSGEETPAKCKLDIASSTAAEEWACKALNGGYTVQPVPTPISTRDGESDNSKEGGNNRRG